MQDWKGTILGWIAACTILLIISILVQLKDRKKDRKKFEQEELEFYFKRLNDEFNVAINGVVPTNLLGKIIFQYWNKNSLVTLFVFPDGEVKRSEGYTIFPWYIPDTEVKAAVRKWLDLVQPLLVNGVRTEGVAIPDKGTVFINWLTTDGWYNIKITSQETLISPHWQQIFDADTHIAEVYDRRRVFWEP